VDLNWIAPGFGLIILLVVGSDYNLLLVSRFQEEIGAGLKTGMIRSMARPGVPSPRRAWCLPSR